MVQFGGYTVPTAEVVIGLAVIGFLVYWFIVKQYKGVPIHAIMFFKGETTGFYFKAGVTEDLDLHKIFIKINKKTTIEFDTTNGSPLEMRVSAYQWVRLYFCSEKTNATLSYMNMIKEAVKTQNLAGETSLRLMVRSKQYIEAIMTQSKDSMTLHLPWLFMGLGIGIAIGMIVMMLFAN